MLSNNKQVPFQTTAPPHAHPHCLSPGFHSAFTFTLAIGACRHVLYGGYVTQVIGLRAVGQGGIKFD